MSQKIEQILIDFMFGEDRQPMPQDYYDNIFKPKLDHAHSAILSLILEKMPKEKLPITNNSGFTLMERVGYNSALAGMRERIEVYYWE